MTSIQAVSAYLYSPFPRPVFASPFTNSCETIPSADPLPWAGRHTQPIVSATAAGRQNGDNVCIPPHADSEGLLRAVYGIPESPARVPVGIPRSKGLKCINMLDSQINFTTSLSAAACDEEMCVHTGVFPVACWPTRVG